MSDDLGFRPHAAHWGAFAARLEDGEVLVRPHPGDPDPSPILGNFRDGLRHRARVATPMVREGWLADGPGPDGRRGRDRFVPMGWDVVLDLLAAELRRVRDSSGPGSVYGGSYGWASAGRFHHAQSQIHRFLNVAMGGYVRLVGSYSAGASTFMLPHILGPFEAVLKRNVTWDQIVSHTDLAVAFGGLPLRNMAVASGGVSRHVERGAIGAARARGCRFVNVSPLRTDMAEEAGAEWLPVVPGTDAALMLGLTQTLVEEGRHDRDFLKSHCAGWERLAAYLRGDADGVRKDAAWAAGITGVARRSGWVVSGNQDGDPLRLVG